MQKSKWSLLTIWVSLGVSFYGFSGHAQVSAPLKKTKHTIKIDQNPFDFVKEITENAGRYRQSRGFANAAQHSAKPKSGASLKYQAKDNGSSGQAQVIYNALVREYGPPKSVRGQSHVWDIENPRKGIIQADMVTVILKMETSGAYELIMDRDRGGNGRATWDATRVQKQRQNNKTNKARK